MKKLILILFVLIAYSCNAQLIGIINQHNKQKSTASETPTDTTAPTAPSNIIVSNITEDSADLSWTGSTDAVGVTAYQIYNDGVFLTNSLGTGTTKSLTSLTAGTEYNITITAIDAALNESVASAEASFTTDGYALASTKKVSIGVYDENDNLLRTLVTNETKTSGNYLPPSWNGLDDDGVDVSAQGDHYLIVANAIEAEWEGVIGNTSDSLNGSTVWKSQNFPKESLIIGTDIYFAWGSNEQDASVQKASLTDYQKRIPLFYQPRIHPGFHNLAYDGSMLYMAGESFWDTNGEARSYVSASTLANMFNYSNWHTWTTSQTNVAIFGNTYKTTDYLEDTVNEPYITGLAVQTGNNNLVVMREEINSIHILHKTTGALRQNITSYNNPKLCKIDSNGFLWFVHGSAGETLEKFTIDNTTGAITSTGITLTGLTNVQALNITPDGNTVVVGDAATYDQFKGYNTTTMSLQWTLGRAESYSVDATVYNDKFMFSNHGDYNNNEPRYTSISFESDGSMWVIDEGNERFIKFDSSRNYVDQIMWKSNFYTAQVDLSDPTRLFASYMEYSIDYSESLELGNGNNAWTLVRNWGKYTHLQSQSVNSNTISPILGVETLSNGRTYGLVVSTGGSTLRFVEFVNGGVVRNTGVSLSYGGIAPSYKKGGIVALFSDPSDWIFSERTITGFDGSHNPVLSSAVEWGRLANADIPFSQYPLDVMDKTDNDIMILFDKRKNTAGNYHLAGVKQGQTFPVFKTTKSVAYSNGSSYPSGLNTFDVRNSVVNAGSRVLTIDDWFMWGYYGEFWESTQTNYWHMLSEEGLFLYDFGTNGKNPPSWAYAKPKMAGNAFGASLVKVSGQVYLYHNDESWHGGVHRWKINNLNSIQKFTIPL